MKALDPRDPKQLQIWVESLARSRREQVRIIKDLVAHADEDAMTALDWKFCQAALQMLCRGYTATKRTYTSRRVA